MKKGLILINAYSPLESKLGRCERLASEFDKLGVKLDVKRNDFFAASVTDDGKLVSRAVNEYDFCIYLDKDKYVSRMLEKCGLRLFNSHAAIEACDDKMLTAVLLADNGIPMPTTLPGLLCYDENEPVRADILDRVERALGYPLVVKMSNGSLGKGVFKVDTREQLVKTAEAVKCTPHLFQRFVCSSFGRDMRVIVIGGKCVAAMVRRSNGDFRSNLGLGGVGTPVDPPLAVKDICERSAALLGLDYCGADVLFGEDDNYYLCEVNSNAFFGGMERVTGKNIAGFYAEHIYKRVYENKP